MWTQSGGDQTTTKCSATGVSRLCDVEKLCCVIRSCNKQSVPPPPPPQHTHNRKQSIAASIYIVLVMMYCKVRGIGPPLGQTPTPYIRAKLVHRGVGVYPELYSRIDILSYLYVKISVLRSRISLYTPENYTFQ